ncbi:hypothetical protein BGZ94_003047 [Podila epigama]|nr:hypothetical protein BGZ94_003047 [Podila epigama]
MPSPSSPLSSMTSASTPTALTSTSTPTLYTPSSPTVVPRSAIRRNHSMSAVQTSASPVSHSPPERQRTRVSGRISMDNYDRARFFRSSVSDTPLDSPVSSSLSYSPPSSFGRKSRHKKSSSSPSIMSSPPLAPAPSPSWFVFPRTPTLAPSNAPEKEAEADVEPIGLTVEDETMSESSQAQGPIPTARSFFGSTFSVGTTPAATPPASPALRAAPTKKSTSSENPSPPPSPSLLARSKAYIPSIPRPSPLMPFRAAQKVVSSVTSVGTGLLPSKEQLGSIPVAGRILRHPVMDSTLTYIASKTTRRGSNDQGGGKAIAPEDVHYRKLNRKLVDQSMTLSALALEKEEQSKYVDDEAGDDAFELYLAAISTLMHALPIETCDPLRREALEAQLTNFLDDHQLWSLDKDEDPTEKNLRRLRRRRHRHHRDHASSLIDHYAPAIDSAGRYTQSSTGHSGPDQASALPSSLPDSTRHHRHRHSQRRQRGGSGGHSNDTSGSSLGDTIINTAVESAIRLKQSPIPDVVRTCFRASRAILNKVDEKFHLQEKAWQISKQSIEKAMELDEQYAIHEVVSETFFATITGLVKAGIAYKETPSYATVRATITPPIQNPSLLTAPPSRRNHPQERPIRSGVGSILPSILRGRRHSIIAEEDEEEDIVNSAQQSRASIENLREGESDGYDTDESSCFSSENQSMSSAASSMSEELQENGTIEMGQYANQVRQRIDLLIALKSASGLFFGNS